MKHQEHKEEHMRLQESHRGVHKELVESKMHMKHKDDEIANLKDMVCDGRRVQP